MGNAGSAHAQASLQVVASLSAQAPLPLDAPEWQSLLTYAQPLSRFDPGEVEREIRPHCAELGASGGWGAGAACSGAEPPPDRTLPAASGLTHIFVSRYCRSVQQLSDAQPAAVLLSCHAAAAACAAAGECCARCTTLECAGTMGGLLLCAAPAHAPLCAAQCSLVATATHACHICVSPLLQGGAGGVTATANAVYCLRTILKDLMEQLNSEQLLSFVEVPEDVAAAAAEAVVAVAEEQAAEAALRGSGGGSGQASPGGSPTGSAAAVAVEFARLHNGSLVQTLVREAVLTLADDALL